MPRSIKHLHFFIFWSLGCFWIFSSSPTFVNIVISNYWILCFWHIFLLSNNCQQKNCASVRLYRIFPTMVPAIFFYGHCDFLHLQWTATRWILERSNSTTFCSSLKYVFTKLFANASSGRTESLNENVIFQDGQVTKIWIDLQSLEDARARQASGKKVWVQFFLFYWK